ncbi:MAG TPA: methionine--tRNA ligase [Victivallales bacterium]|nr:methionine--tRNA ligase [Victivallales bacterium]
MSNKPFYLTTPIYYVNGKPHIGHAYTTILADVLTRYQRLLGVESYFLTGTDEHGAKIQEAAEQQNITPQEQCDSTFVRFKELWDKLNITNDDFIRTTENRHKVVVKKILQDLYDRDLIYKAEYKGWYCTPCERFFTEKDLLEGNLCPECKRKTNELIESNYFFRMSKYQDWLIDYIKNNPDFIQPAFRANETLGFLKQPLGDLCISRPKARLSWGIDLPFDDEYVCYVWFDALVNYISAVGYLSDKDKFNKWWPASYHLMAKDILTTHTVYWPTMLKAIGLEMPKSIFAHGYWLTGKDKMSKSFGNVVDPMEMVEKYGVDAFRYFLMAEMTLGQDASFTEEAFIRRYNTDLANDLGNFLNRVTKFTLKQCDGVIPEPGTDTEAELEFRESVVNSVAAMKDAIDNMRLDRGLDAVIGAVRAGNRYMEKTAPWKLAKDKETERLNTVLYYTAEALRIIAGLLYPVIPEKAAIIRKSLGLDNDDINITKLQEWGGIKPGTQIVDTGVLFPRIDLKEKKKANIEQMEKENKPVDGVKLISIDDFFKSELKTAKIISAEKVKNTTKLLKLKIEVGSEKRQIVAGIAQFYQPDNLIGKTIIVVSNLKPAKICGIESNGMLLAAKSKKELKIVTVDGEMPSGLSVV